MRSLAQKRLLLLVALVNCVPYFWLVLTALIHDLSNAPGTEVVNSIDNIMQYSPKGINIAFFVIIATGDFRSFVIVRANDSLVAVVFVVLSGNSKVRQFSCSLFGYLKKKLVARRVKIKLIVTKMLSGFKSRCITGGFCL